MNLVTNGRTTSQTLFPVYTTVTQPALDKLLEKLPKKFGKKMMTMHRNLLIKEVQSRQN